MYKTENIAKVVLEIRARHLDVAFKIVLTYFALELARVRNVFDFPHSYDWLGWRFVRDPNQASQDCL